MAVRIAQDLRLMLRQPADIPPSIQEERRRTFWSIYLLDRLVSCGRGKPPAILDASCQLQLPYDEALWRKGLWKETLTLEQLSDRILVNSNAQGPFAHVIMISQTLGRAAQYMLQGCNLRNRYPPWDASSDFTATESELLLLETHFQIRRPVREIMERYIIAESNIDQASASSIVFSRALFHLCYCILYHPFLLRKRIQSFQGTVPPSFLTRTFVSGWHHANALTQHLRDAREAGCYAQASFYGYCAVVSGTIASLNTHSASVETQNQSHMSLQQNIAFLEDLSRYWVNAYSMVR